MGSTTVVYVSSQCPNCDRLLKILNRIQLNVRIIDVDRQRVEGLTAVPTIVLGNHHGQNRVMVGTAAFEWLQTFESKLPLEAYATVLGESANGLSYTELDSGETIDASPFTQF